MIKSQDTGTVCRLLVAGCKLHVTDCKVKKVEAKEEEVAMVTIVTMVAGLYGNGEWVGILTAQVMVMTPEGPNFNPVRSAGHRW